MANVAVIDVETTGLNPYRHDRIVELAVLVVRSNGEVLREFITLVNPERDIGPTRIHGIHSREIIGAPRFDEIVGTLVQVLDGCVAVAGHNVRFDYSFLSAEFERLGHSLPDAPQLCTMHLAGGGSLTCVCSDYEIEFDGETHSAQHDARAAARLLAKLLEDEPGLVSEISRRTPIVWPRVPITSASPMTRDEARKRRHEPPAYLQRLLARAQRDIQGEYDDEAILAYTSLLDRVLEDRHVDEEEGQTLVELATRWAIPASQVEKANWDYLVRLGVAALADGIVTGVEREDLGLVASLLGLGPWAVDEILETIAQKSELVEELKQPEVVLAAPSQEELAGKSVCFTGEFQCRVAGEVMTREATEAFATHQGMITKRSVTKNLDLLVVADPLTQSGKARKARQYGIRIMHELIFWRTLGVEVE